MGHVFRILFNIHRCMPKLQGPQKRMAAARPQLMVIIPVIFPQHIFVALFFIILCDVALFPKSLHLQYVICFHFHLFLRITLFDQKRQTEINLSVLHHSTVLSDFPYFPKAYNLDAY